MALSDAKVIEMVEAIELLRSAGWTIEPPASNAGAKRVGRPPKKRVGRPPKKRVGRPPKKRVGRPPKTEVS
jgi:hypothetical protein